MAGKQMAIHEVAPEDQGFFILAGIAPTTDSLGAMLAGGVFDAAGDGIGSGFHGRTPWPTIGPRIILCRQGLTSVVESKYILPFPIIPWGYTEGTLRYKALGALIKRHRLAKGMTQKQIARALGCTRECVANWERGYPPASRLWRLIDILGMDPFEVMSFFIGD